MSGERSDLVAKLRLEGDATGAVKAVQDTKAAVSDPKETAEGVGPSMEGAAEATADLGAAADVVTTALERSAEAAGGVANSGNQLAEAAAQAAGGLVKEAAALEATAASSRILQEISDGTAQAKGRLTTAIGGMSGAARIAGTALGGLVNLMGGPAVVATGLLLGAVMAIRQEYKEFEEAQRATEQAIADMSPFIRQAERDTAELAQATSDSAAQSRDAAVAYTAQGMAAAEAAKQIREMTAAQRQASRDEAEKQIEQIDNARGGQLPFTTNNLERIGNLRRDIIKDAFGISSPGGMASGDPVSGYLAQLNRDAERLPAGLQKSLAEYNRLVAADKDALITRQALVDKVNKIDQADLPGLKVDDGATEVAEIVVEGSRKVEAAHKAVAAAAGGRTKATDEAREAEQRLARAGDIEQRAQAEIATWKARAAAVLEGEAAIERQQIAEAGLRVLQELGVESLEELTGAVRERAQAAMEAAEAAEAEQIAAQKTIAVQRVLTELAEDGADVARQRDAALAGSTRAEVEYARQLFIRQQLERAGKNLTADQTTAITAQADALFKLNAALDEADVVGQQQQQLQLLALTAQERELEIRARERAKRLQAEMVDLSDEEATARARALTAQEMQAESQAQAIGGLRDGLREAFIESGELGFDQVADYATQRLREAVYDALLARPIDVLINLVVGGVEGLAGQIGGLGGGLLGQVLSGATIGGMIGKGLGLGTGNTAADIGLSLGGGALGSAAGGAMGGWAAAAAGKAALLGTGSSMMASAAGWLAPMMGPLGAIAGLAIGKLVSGLFADDKRPYARADIGVVNGQFGVVGGQALDKGPLDEMNQAAQAIAQSLNAAADLFKLDLSKLGGLDTSVGYVKGKNLGELQEGFFGGAGGGFNTGAQLEGYADVEGLAADIVKATIVRAIEMGASDLTAAEQQVVRSAATLEEAAGKIAAGRGFLEGIEDAILQLTDPEAAQQKSAMAAIEETYAALKAQAEELISAGLVPAEALEQIERLRDLQVAEALERFGGALDGATASVEAAARAQKGLDDLGAEVAAGIKKILDPLGYERDQAMAAIDANYEALKARAQELVAAGAAAGDVFSQLESLRDLQVDAALASLAASADQAASALANAAAEMAANAASLQRTVQLAALDITDADAAARERALDAVNSTADAWKEEAERLIAEGALSEDFLAEIERVRELQAEAELKRLEEERRRATASSGGGGGGYSAPYQPAVSGGTSAAQREAEQAAAEAARRAQDGRDLVRDIQMQLLDLTSPEVAPQARVHEDIQRLRKEAEALGVLDQVAEQLSQLEQLRIDEALNGLAGSAHAARKAMLDWLKDLDQTSAAELSPQAQRDAAKETYQRELELARAGSSAALGGLTRYADALFAADREATSSAQERRALYDQVRADIEALATAEPAPVVNAAQIDLAMIAGQQVLAVANDQPLDQASLLTLLTQAQGATPQTLQLIADRISGGLQTLDGSLADRQRELMEEVKAFLDEFRDFLRGKRVDLQRQGVDGVRGQSNYTLAGRQERRA